MIDLEKTKRYKSLYADIVDRVAQMSYANRLKVGAIVVKDGNIISMGWNGMPEGYSNVCEYEDDLGILVTKPECMHAEFNAVRKLAKSVESANGADMYVTHAPCLNCALLISGTGIRNVFFKEYYKNILGIEHLEKSGVNVIKI